MAIWCILWQFVVYAVVSRFGIIYQEKSGSPAGKEQKNGASMSFFFFKAHTPSTFAPPEQGKPQKNGGSSSAEARSALRTVWILKELCNFQPVVTQVSPYKNQRCSSELYINLSPIFRTFFPGKNFGENSAEILPIFRAELATF
jgi:hypothetical protein